MDESSERIHLIAAWREAPYFSDGERAALALTEAMTRLADHRDPVPDEVWDAAARHFTEEQLAALVVAIASINAFNRVNVATRQITGEWTDQIARHVVKHRRPGSLRARRDMGDGRLHHHMATQADQPTAVHRPPVTGGVPVGSESV